MTRTLYREKLRTVATAAPIATNIPRSQKEVGCSSVWTRCLWERGALRAMPAYLLLQTPSQTRLRGCA